MKTELTDEQVERGLGKAALWLLFEGTDDQREAARVFGLTQLPSRFGMLHYIAHMRHDSDSLKEEATSAEGWIERWANE